MDRVPGENWDGVPSYILSLIHISANGIAEYIAGSVNGFVDMMNARAAEIGCTNTHFVNPHGLHDDDHYTCAKDMALIAQEAFKNKTFRKIVGTVEYNIPPTNKTEETPVSYTHLPEF